MKILLFSDSFNCLTQRAFAELTDRGHDVSVEFAISAQSMMEAVSLFKPELIVAPMLTKVIPEEIWRNHTCLIVHPGIMGDRGPSSLDWAILEGEEMWGVTIVEAAAEMDAGDIWWSKTFAMPNRSKSSIYRREVVKLAIEGIACSVDRFSKGGFKPLPLDYSRADVLGKLRPPMKAHDRAIDWQIDDSATVLRKIRCGDSQPGAQAMLRGEQFHIFDAHPGPGISAEPGQIIGRVGAKLQVATIDGSVLIGQLRRKAEPRTQIKLPAGMLIGDQCQASKDDLVIHYEAIGDCALLYFEFYNGAMSTEGCHRLSEAYAGLVAEKPRAIVLMGGQEFFSNGIDLNTIEAAADPREEAWQNILAMNGFVRQVLLSKNCLTISMLRANAGAGGAMMALASDFVWADENATINPHYQAMGGLYGSEYWTYTLPKRVGAEKALALTESLLPLTARSARQIGLVDEVFHYQKPVLIDRIQQELSSSAMASIFWDKRELVGSTSWLRHIDDCVASELARMRDNFFAPDTPFHRARKSFVYKLRPESTPLHLARHRRRDQ